jgi:ABC-2 type transport system permease protein
MPANPPAGPAGTGTATRAGVIHDLGYQRYDGPRFGRPQIIRALTWHSFRAAFGFGRGPKSKILPVIALLALCLPAVINAFAMSTGNPQLVGYSTYNPQLRVVVMIIFVAVQAPELVSKDLRSRVLPLYFSRPIETIDYPLAKFLAFTGACLVMMWVPLFVLYGGTIANVHGGAAVWAQTKELIPGLLIGLMWAVVLAAISLFLASVTGRRAFATGIVAISFLLTWVLSQILLQVESNIQQQGGGPAQPVSIKGGPPPGGAPGGVVHIIASAAPPPDLAEKVSGLFSPFTLMDGTRMWLHSSEIGDQVQNPGSFGAVYALVLVVLVGLCLYGLVARYRKARLS